MVLLAAISAVAVLLDPETYRVDMLAEPGAMNYTPVLKQPICDVSAGPETPGRHGSLAVPCLSVLTDSVIGSR